MADEVVRNLCGNVELPKMIKVEQQFNKACIEPEEIPEKITELLNRDVILSKFKPGMTVAITCGSRGVSNIAIIIKSIVDVLKERGVKPFVFPAMGSHGGATAEGQLEIVTGYGVTEEYLGCPVRATMETVQVGQVDDGRPVFIDKYASEADGIILVGRIKAHTQFVGPYESGLMKMAVIGMGKQHGAETVHVDGFGKLSENIPAFGKIILKNTNVICGVGSIENAYDKTYKLVALTPDEIIEQEPKLLLEAKANMGHILIDNADVLIVDEIGKDISGDGMDPNVTGTLPRETGVPSGKDGSFPRLGNFKAKRVVVLGLTEKTHGNANGIGLADITTQRCIDQTINEMAYPNALTSNVLEMVKWPFWVQTDKLAIQVAAKTSVGADPNALKIIRIKNTREIEEIEVSEALVEEVKQHPNMKIIGTLQDFAFDDNGNLF